MAWQGVGGGGGLEEEGKGHDGVGPWRGGVGQGERPLRNPRRERTRGGGGGRGQRSSLRRKRRKRERIDQ